MKKKIRLFDYRDKEKEITIKDFEKVAMFMFEIISGDGVLTAIYQDHIEEFDSSTNRFSDFQDGRWFIKPENIDILNRMKSHHDTDELEESSLF